MTYTLQTLNKAEGAKLPSTEGYSELKGDLALKEREVKNSEMTMDAILIGILYNNLHLSGSFLMYW